MLSIRMQGIAVQKVGAGDTAPTGLLQFRETQGAFAAGHHNAAGIRRQHLAGAAVAGNRIAAPNLDFPAGERRHRARKGIEGADLARQDGGRLGPVEPCLGLVDLVGIGQPP